MTCRVFARIRIWFSSGFCTHEHYGSDPEVRLRPFNRAHCHTYSGEQCAWSPSESRGIIAVFCPEISVISIPKPRYGHVLLLERFCSFITVTLFFPGFLLIFWQFFHSSHHWRSSGIQPRPSSFFFSFF